jgi:hypothetical protein
MLEMNKQREAMQRESDELRRRIEQLESASK